MFQLDWAIKSAWNEEEKIKSPGQTALDRGSVRKTALLLWEEHCHECAIPTCYSTCSLYVGRADKKCARFVYGIYPNPNLTGQFSFGADIRFRRWAKLEAQLSGKSISVEGHR